MRRPYLHEAWLELAADADARAPGAAVTAELCGHWEHDGVCRWPHHTAVAEQSGQSMRIRTVFVCDEGEDDAVRRRISRALGAGRLDGPEGTSRWAVVRDEAGELRPAERRLAERLSTP